MVGDEVFPVRPLRLVCNSEGTTRSECSLIRGNDTQGYKTPRRSWFLYKAQECTQARANYDKFRNEAKMLVQTTKYQ